MKKSDLPPILLIFAGVSILSWFLFLPILEARASLFSEERGAAPTSPAILSFGRTLSRSFNLPRLPFSSLLTTGKSIDNFFLTIEKLGIKRAKIIANLEAEDPSIYLKELLNGVGHLKGSAFPGQAGNIFIFGHSSLPFLFNSGDYSTIFSNLQKLDSGDLILIEFAGNKFYYRVDNLKTVSSGSRVGEFDSQREQLTILTCFPPGLLTQRLIVTAYPLN